MMDIRLSSMVEQLLEPPKNVQDAEHRRQARLLSILIFIATPVAFVMIFLSWQESNYDISTLLMGIVVLIGFIIAFFVSRTQYFQLAGFAIVILITGSASASIVIDTIYGVPLSYVGFSSLIAVMILSTHTALIATTLNIIIAIVISPHVPSVSVNNELTFLVILTMAVWIITLLRRYDFEEIQNKNREVLIMKQQQLEIELENKKAHLLANFIKDVSHDIKTPLSIIETSVYLLTKQLPEQNHDRLHKIQNQVAFLAKIVDDLMSMTRLDEAVQLNITVVNINLLLTEISNEVSITTQNQAIQHNLDPNLPDISGDATELYRCFINLMQFALSSVSDGGDVFIESKKQDSCIVVIIKDTGKGILAEDLPFIFDRFYRIDKARTLSKDSSTSLGLAIAKRVVELHHGSLSVTSEVGMGTQFHIELPVAHTHTPDAQLIVHDS